MSYLLGSRLNASMTREIYDAKRSEFYRTLCLIRGAFDSMIKEAASRGFSNVLLEVPRSYMGTEPYDRVEMGREIVKQLHEDGYDVSGSNTRIICSWGDSSVSSAGSSSKKNKKPTKVIRVPSVSKAPRRS